MKNDPATSSPFVVADLPRYVRQSLVEYARQRRGPIKFGPDSFTICGYSELSLNAKNNFGFFARRVFWLKGNDPYPGDGVPCEAVTPSTVKIGVMGRFVPSPKNGGHK